MNCSSPIDIGLLVVMAIGNHTWSPAYDCRHFSRTLADELGRQDCDFRLVTGWNAPAGTPGRQLHRYIEMPGFYVEPRKGTITPYRITNEVFIHGISYGEYESKSGYDRMYATAWNWSHL